MSAKTPRLVLSELIDLPVVEASGVAVRRTGQGPVVLVIGDRTAEVGVCRIGDDGALEDWTTIDLAQLPDWPAPDGDSQFEAIAADGGSLVAVMREDPPVVLVADTSTRELRLPRSDSPLRRVRCSTATGMTRRRAVKGSCSSAVVGSWWRRRSARGR